MTKEIFIDTLNKMKESMDYAERIGDEFGIEIFELPPSNAAGWFFDRLWEETLTEEGHDILGEYFFDYQFGFDGKFEDLIKEIVTGKEKDKKPFVVNGVEIKSYEDLYDFLYANKMFVNQQ